MAALSRLSAALLAVGRADAPDAMVVVAVAAQPVAPQQ